jgi:hypothetical protein
MRTLTLSLALCSLLSAALTIGTGAQGKSMPPETAKYRASDLPGYTLVLRNCLTCHSAQYVSTQPPTSSRNYWEATVRKMQKPFGAEFPVEDIPAMVDYLAKEYGAEGRSAASGRPSDLLRRADDAQPTGDQRSARLGVH